MPRNSSDYLGKELATLKQQVKQLQKGRLGNASMHGGGLPYYDDEGNLRAIFGDQGDGSWGAGVVSSPPQPTPTAPVVVQVDKYGRASATWDGEVVSGQVPRVHGRVDVHTAFSPDGSEPGLSEYQFAATIWEREGGTAPIVCPQPGTWFVRLQMVGADERTKGAMSDPATVDIEGLVDTDAIEAELEAARERLAEAEAEARQALDEVGQVRDEWAVEYPRLQGEIQDAQTAVADAEARLEQTRLGMENLRDVRLPELQNALSTGLQDANEWREVGAISAESLRVGNWQDMIPDPAFSSTWWRFTGPRTVVPSYTRNGVTKGPVAVLTGSGREMRTQRFKAIPGASYVLEFEHECSGTWQGADYEVFIAGLTSTGGWIGTLAPSVRNYASTAWGKESISFTIPETMEGLSQWEVVWRVIEAPNLTLRTTNPSLRRRVDAHVIMDATIFARHLAVESVSAAIAEFLSLSAQDATVQNLAARIATLIELNASRITTGRLGAERVDVESFFAQEGFIENLRAAVVTALQVTAERGFIGGALLADNTIDVAKLNVTEQMTAELAQFLVVNAGQIAANAIDGMTIRGGHLEGGTIAIGSPDEQGQTGFAVDAQGRMRATGADIDGDITAQSVALRGDLIVGSGSASHGRLAVDGNMLRLQGMAPVSGQADARDTFYYRTTGFISIPTAANNGEARNWDILYRAPAPTGTRGAMVTPVTSQPHVTANTTQDSPDGFRAVYVPHTLTPSGSRSFRIRYLAMWRTEP